MRGTIAELALYLVILAVAATCAFGVIRMNVGWIRLRREGLRANGVLVGVLGSQQGLRPVVRFEDCHGRSHEVTGGSTKSRVLNPGDPMGVLYLPRNPSKAEVLPLRGRVGDTIFSLIAFPVLCLTAIWTLKEAILVAKSVLLP
ncbi:hypothetical protein ADK38_13870 [Streptomyces varsoviensis]|uniref:DUF3592 domain-containing protein n=2 Tax=Streptomyces varsoviensis TaxID=67373 RepID=A0ABR5J845_9ACTN|nr:hypothetical protein ADK38_13870 [Streptomyces varsoviensis]